MAHLQKFTRSAIGHICAHLDRSAAHISNSNLDSSKTHLNYAFTPPSWLVEGNTPYERISTLMSKYKCLNRSDVNVLCDWCITKPKDLDPKYTQQFFEESWKFFTNRYGLQNTIGAYVHLDEITEHMHYAFCPIKNGRFNAKEVISKSELKTLHKELQQHLEAALGVRVNILKDVKEAKYYTVNELKDRSNFNEVVNKLKDEIDVLRSQRDDVNHELVDLKAQKVAYEQYQTLMSGNEYSRQQLTKINNYNLLERYCPQDLDKLISRAKTIQHSRCHSLPSRENVDK